MADLLGLFAEHILPILLVAAVGFLLQRLLRLDPRPISQITFYVLSPALVFNLLTASDIGGSQVLGMMALAVLVIIATAGLSLVIGRLLRLEPSLAAAFLISATFMNAGNYGLSLNQFAFGEPGLAWASLFFVASVMMTNSLGVYVASRGRSGRLAALRGLAKVPAMYAIPLALAVKNLDLVVPLPVDRPLQLLGNAAVPVMLLILGMQIGAAGLSAHRGLLAAASGIKLLVAPAIAVLAAPLLLTTELAHQVGILEAAMPTAVMSTIIAIEFDVEPTFVTGVVLVSTVLSPITLTVLLAVFS